MEDSEEEQEGDPAAGLPLPWPESLLERRSGERYSVTLQPRPAREPSQPEPPLPVGLTALRHRLLPSGRLSGLQRLERAWQAGLQAREVLTRRQSRRQGMHTAQARG